MLRNILPAILALLLLATASLAEASKKTKGRSGHCDAALPTSQWTRCTGLGRYPDLLMPNYEGPWLDGKPHGHGRMFTDQSIYGESSEYTGEFKYGTKAENPDCGNYLSKPASLVTIVSKTRDKVRYVSKDVIDSRSGMLGVSHSSKTIRITIARGELHSEFEAYLVKADTKRKSSANPGGTGVLLVLTAGLLLLTPGDATTGFFGCSDLIVSEYKPAAEPKPQATGKYKILYGKDVVVNESYLVSRPGTVKIFIKTSKFERTFRPNLESTPEGYEIASLEIAESDLALLNPDALTHLEINCESCGGDTEIDNWDSPEWKSFHPVKTMEIEADFREETKLVIDKQKQLAEEEWQKALAGDGTPDNLICKKRGFTPTTQPYEKCRKDVVLQRERAEQERKAKAIRDAETAKKVQEEREMRRKEEQARKAEEARDAAEIKSIAPRMSFDEAKEKCANLGFAAGTEKFGSCVLQLTK